MNRANQRRATGWPLILMCACAAAAADSGSTQDPIDTHAAHQHAAASESVKRSVVVYTVPALRLIRSDGKAVSLDAEVNDGRPVVVNFIYTSCTTTCPLGSQELSVLQDRLASARAEVHLVSISIDPEEDTPSRLQTYARHFHAGKNWQYYTGTATASARAQQAFDVYRGDKMSHSPVTLLRAASGNSWIRLEGFATADQLYDELRDQGVIPAVPLASN
jgi:protein SCO1/2